MVEYSFYFINVISGLVGIIIGGFVTFITQIKVLKTKDKLDRKKELFKSYNDFLKQDRKTSPIIYNPTTGYKSFDTNIYIDNIRDILIENLHLLDSHIIKSIINIEENIDIYQYEMEDIYLEFIYQKYELIKKQIYDDLKIL